MRNGYKKDNNNESKTWNNRANKKQNTSFNQQAFGIGGADFAGNLKPNSWDQFYMIFIWYFMAHKVTIGPMAMVKFDENHKIVIKYQTLPFTHNLTLRSESHCCCSPLFAICSFLCAFLSIPLLLLTLFMAFWSCDLHQIYADICCSHKHRKAFLSFAYLSMCHFVQSKIQLWSNFLSFLLLTECLNLQRRSWLFYQCPSWFW